MKKGFHEVTLMDWMALECEEQEMEGDTQVLNLSSWGMLWCHLLWRRPTPERLPFQRSRVQWKSIFSSYLKFEVPDSCTCVDVSSLGTKSVGQGRSLEK